MAIRLVVSRGFGNGTYNGTIADVATRGYTIGAAVTEFPYQKYAKPMLVTPLRMINGLAPWFLIGLAAFP